MFARAFWLYLAARFCTATAMMMLRATVAWHVYALSHSAFHLGLIGLVQFLPIPALMLIGGALADVRDRRRIMMAAQAVTLACAVVLATATGRDAASLVLLYVIVLVVGAAWAFDAPSRAALLPTLVPRDVFPRAVTIAGTNQALAFATGPALAGWTIAAGGIAASYAAQAALVAASLVMLGALRTPSRTPSTTRFDLRAIREGLRFVVRNRVVLGCMTLDLLAVIFGGAAALLPIYARDILGTGPWGLGLLRAAPASGALATSLVLARRPVEHGAGPVLFGAVAVFGVATVVFGVSTDLTVSLVALVVLGASDLLSVVIRHSLVQMRTPDGMRGRVSAVHSLFTGTSNQLGEFESGLLAALFGPIPAVLIGGVGTIVVAALWMVRFPELRRFDLTDS